MLMKNLPIVEHYLTQGVNQTIKMNLTTQQGNIYSNILQITYLNAWVIQVNSRKNQPYFKM